ncbi:MAG TPA: HlyD family type I secretion periplasmic adaptor subunit [Xanthobacteraceae bacterium]|jgi:adhesin transport system membrane fusion protein
MRHSDFAYVNDVRAAVELRTPRTARMLLITIGAMLFCALVWANFAILDEVKRGSGRVIPSQQMQVVQSLEGGIVQEILIQEGAIVKKGQPLMRIDDTNFAAQLGEVRERRAAMAARVARLEAEANGAQRPVFEPVLRELAPKVVATELSVFEARTKKIAQDVDVLQQAQSRLTNNLELLNRELEITRKLYAQKVVPEIEMIRLERQASETRGQLAETNSRLTNVKTSFASQVEEDLAKSKGDLAVLDETIKSAQDKVRRAELRAPVYGIVNKLNVTTVGAVVQPASNVMDIVPLDDTLLVEGRIRPQDIAFIRPGQDAVVKITAYDPSVYGSLKGKVERISADTIAERNEKGEIGETFYRVIVRTEKNALGTPETPLPIIPGMVATVEVLTGTKSVLDYLLKPARLLRDEALRER